MSVILTKESAGTSVTGTPTLFCDDAIGRFFHDRLVNNDPVVLQAILKTDTCNILYASPAERLSRDLRNNRGEAMAYVLAGNDPMTYGV